MVTVLDAIFRVGLVLASSTWKRRAGETSSLELRESGDGGKFAIFLQRSGRLQIVYTRKKEKKETGSKKREDGRVFPSSSKSCWQAFVKKEDISDLAPPPGGWRMSNSALTPEVDTDRAGSLFLSHC